MKHILLFLVAIFCLITGCNLFEEPSEISFLDPTLGAVEYVVFSKPNGKIAYYQKMQSGVRTTYSEFKSPYIHLTTITAHDTIAQLDRAFYWIETFMELTPDDYTYNVLRLGCCDGFGQSYPIEVSNLGNDFVVGNDNPLVSGLLRDEVFEPNWNGGTLTGNVWDFGSSDAYMLFFPDDENKRRYFYQANISSGNTIVADYNNMFPISPIGKISFGKTYDVGRTMIVGRSSGPSFSHSLFFSKKENQLNVSEVDVLIPPIGDFDDFYVAYQLTDETANETIFSARSAPTATSVPATFSRPDWTYTLEDATWNNTKLETRADIDVVVFNFKIDTDDVLMHWKIVAPSHELIELPEIRIPDELLANHDMLNEFVNLELDFIELIDYHTLSGYSEFIEVQLNDEIDFREDNYTSITIHN